MSADRMGAVKPLGPRGCSGHSKRHGGLCGGQAVKGTDKCFQHSGKTIAQQKAEGQVTLELHRWGLDSSLDKKLQDPGLVLLRLVTQSAMRIADLSVHVGRLADSEGLDAVIVCNTYGEFGKTGEQIRSLYRAECEERDRCANFAAKAVAAGVSERLVRIAERDGQHMLKAAVKAAEECGFSPEVRDRFLRLLGAQLRGDQG